MWPQGFMARVTMSFIPKILRLLALFVTQWTTARQAPLAGIFQARILRWVAISSSRDLPYHSIEPALPASPALQVDS